MKGERIKILDVSGKLRGYYTEKSVAERAVAEGFYKIVTPDTVQRTRKTLKPKGWKEVGTEKIVREWTNEKTGVKIVVTRYYNPDSISQKGHFGYNLLEIDAKGKTKVLKDGETRFWKITQEVIDRFGGLK